MMLALASLNVKAQTPDGSNAKPYPIKNLEALNALRDCMNGSAPTFYFHVTDSMFVASQGEPATDYLPVNKTVAGICYKLLSDIDLNPGKNVAACDGDGTGLTEWVPINTFYGRFDGGYHIVSGVFVNQPSATTVGFFKEIASGSVVKNLGVVNSYVSGKREVGGLAGNTGGCHVTHCFVDAVIVSSAMAADLNDQSDGRAETGGITGKATSTTIDTCYATGSITSRKSYLGGVCGNGVGVNMTSCYSSVVINYFQEQYVGGLAGELKEHTVTKSYYDQQMCPANISNTDGTGKVTTAMLGLTTDDLGDNFVYTAGYYPSLKGFSDTNAYVRLSTVPLLLQTEQTMNQLTENFEVGGTGDGMTWESTSDRYAKVNATNQVEVYNKEGWLQLKASMRGKNHTVAFYTNTNVTEGTIGTETNPYPIDSYTDLSVFRDGVNSAKNFDYKHFIIPSRAEGTWFRQTCDISLAPVDNWQDNYKIGKSDVIAFAGGYDGGGHAVTDLKVTSGQYGGFFGFVKNGTVKNLDVVVSVFAPGEKSGPLCAQVEGRSTVDNCRALPVSSSVELKLLESSGGLIGLTKGMKGTISNCTNNCNIVPGKINYVSPISGVIGNNLEVDSLIIRNCQNNGSITGSNVDKLGGITAKVDGALGKSVLIEGCKNTGSITILNLTTYTQIGGILGLKSGSLKVTISHCENYGNITSPVTAAGIVCSAVDSLSHCVNAGDIWVKDIGQTRVASAFGIASGTNVYSSLNAGKVTSDIGGDAYGICNYGAFDCMNAGEITAHSEGKRAYPLTGWNGKYKSAARNINIGRVNGVSTVWGVTVGDNKTKNFCDQQLVFDAHSSGTYVTQKNTSEMLGSDLSEYLGSNWVYADGMYPRIKGLDTLPISIVTATPVIFGNGQTINSVSSDFHVGCTTEGVVWNYNGAPVTSEKINNQQQVAVGDNLVGMKTLTVTYDGVTKTVRFCRNVSAPSGTLDVASMQDLRTLRDGVNTGAPFIYNGTIVPARAAGTKFKQTADLTMGSEDVNWVPIGKVDAIFVGTYDGGFKTIQNLRQQNVLNGGLFGYGYYANISNVNMVNVNISEVRACGGALMAVSNRDNIKYCTASGEISSYTTVVANVNKNIETSIGGIVGNGYYSKVTSCVNNCHVRGYDLSNAGGILGRGYYNPEGFLDSCANYGQILGDYCVGGLIGGYAQLIKNSYNAGDVRGTESAIYIGGLTGHGAYVHNCFNTGMVTAETSTRESYVGGLVGEMRNAKDAEIKYNYNAGIVEANRMYVGGIFGCSVKKNQDNNDSKKTDSIKVHHNYVSNAVSSSGANVGAIFGYHIVDSALVKTGSNNVPYIYNNYYDTTFCYLKGVGRRYVPGSGFVYGTDVVGKAEGKGTREMVGEQLMALLGESDFTYGDTNYYPRIHGAVSSAWPASLASAARLQLQYGQRSKSVDSNFTVGGCADDVRWGLKGGGNAIAFDNDQCQDNACAAEIQKLGVVYALSSHSGIPYKAIKLYVGNSVTNPLEIINETELIHFRDFISGGIDFFYDIDTKTFHSSDAGITNAFPITDQGKDLYFKLTCDVVDLSDNGDWDPIGTKEHPFKGFFNGGEHTITGMQCTSAGDNKGMFGYLQGGSIDSLYFTNAQLQGTGNNKGVVCGYNDDGFITECKSDNSVINLEGADNDAWGGICGYQIKGTVQNCSSSGCVINGGSSSVANVGGVLGYGYDGKVKDCSVTVMTFTSSEGQNNGGICGKVNKNSIEGCRVDGSTFVFNSQYGGGICGADTCGFIERCSFVNSTITAEKDHVGGILGFGFSNDLLFKVNITDCYTAGGSISAPNSSNVGGLFGELLKATYVVVDKCNNNIPVVGKEHVGGVSGAFGGEMLNTYNTARVEGSSKVGGLVGVSTEKSTMFYDYNVGDVEASGDYAGGLLGYNPILHIGNSFNSGRVKGKNYVGGLSGESGACEQDSYNAGQVYGQFYVGGIAGRKYYYGGTGNSGTAADTSERNYNIGYVDGNNLVGALYGEVDSTDVKGLVQMCFYDKQFSFSVGVGGVEVPGHAEGKLTSEMTGTALSLGDTWLYVDTLYPQVKNLHDSAFSRKTSLATASPFVIPANMVAWDVTDKNGTPELYGRVPTGTRWQTANGSLVLVTTDNRTFTIHRVGILDMETYDQGTDSVYKRVRMMVNISEEHPIEIKDLAEMAKFRNFINAGTVFFYDAEGKTFHNANDGYNRRIEIPAGGESMYFKLTTDLDLALSPTDIQWTPVGNKNKPFKGYFDGGDHVIANLTVPKKIAGSNDYHGLFGYSTGSVKNLTLLAPNVNGGQFVGAVCGYNNGGIVSHCAVVGGTVQSSSSNTGGVCGRSENGTVSCCYNSSNVTSKTSVGGICGQAKNSVTSECFNMGRVTSFANNANDVQNHCGGIVGYNLGDDDNHTTILSDCYNTGIVTGIRNVGGIAGCNEGGVIERVYNAGTVTGRDTLIGGLSNVKKNQSEYYPKNALTDKRMAPGVAAIDGMDPNNQVTETEHMVGEAMQSMLGSDKWIYSDSLYPRLKVFGNDMASYVSASPIFFNGALNVNGVSSEFVAYNYNKTDEANDVHWELLNQSDAADMSHANTTGRINIKSCELVSFEASFDSLTREIDVQLIKDSYISHKDTTCGEPYTWAYNEQIYTQTIDVVDEVVGASGCKVITTLALIIPQPLAVTLTPNVSCGSTDQNSISATVSGGIIPGDYAYSWTKDGDSEFTSNEPSIPNPSSGTYTVTVTDPHNTKNCPAVTQSVTIEEPAAPTVSDVTANGHCYNNNDGEVSFTIAGGMPPYHISWTGPATGSVDQALPGTFAASGLSNGEFTFTVADAKECTVQEMVTVEDYDNNPYEIIAYGITKLYDGVAVSPDSVKVKVGDDASPWMKLDGNHQVTYQDMTFTVELSTQGTASLVNACVTTNSINSVTVTKGGVDITCQLNLTTTDGAVVINKRNVVMTSGTEVVNSESLDATASNYTVTISGDGFEFEPTLIGYSGFPTQSGIGSIRNTFDYSLPAAANADNYNITKVYGILTIIDNHHAIVYADTNTKMYDGTPLYATVNVAVPSDVYVKFRVNNSDEQIQLGPGTQQSLVGVSITDAGSLDVAISDVHVFDNTHELTTEIPEENRMATPGQLKITPRPVTLTSYSHSWEYDGTAHTYPTVTVSGEGFVDGEVSTIQASGSITAVGQVTNSITYTNTENSSFNENNYDITMNPGTLTITPRSVTYLGETRTVPYTGETQCAPGITASGLVTGHTLVFGELTHSACRIVPGTTVGTFTGTPKVMSGTTDVTDNYTPIYEVGGITVQPSNQLITIRSVSAGTDYYDGQVHRYQQYEVLYGGSSANVTVDETGKIFTLPTGDKVTITPKDSGNTGIKHVQPTPALNDFEYVLENSDRYDPSSISVEKGTINLQKRQVRIVAATSGKVYDGLPFSEDVASIAGMGFAQGDSINNITWPVTNYVDAGLYVNKFNKPTFREGTRESDYDTILVPGTLTISKAMLTVMANDTSHVYGSPAPQNLRYTLSGFVTVNDVEETEAALRSAEKLSGFPVLTQTTDVSTPVGSNYPIEAAIGDLTATNYDFQFENGRMVVTLRPIYIEPEPLQGILYDGESHSLPGNHPYTVRQRDDNSGLLVGDAVTAVSMNGSARLAGHHVGAITVSGCVIKHGSENVTDNYQLVSVDTFIQINAISLTIKVTKNGTHEYDGQPHCEDALTVLSNGLKYTVEGFADKDAISSIAFTGGGTAYREETYPVNVEPNTLFIVNSDLEPNVNVKSCYDITYHEGDIRITPNYAPIKIESGSKHDFFYTGEPQQYVNYTIYYNNSTTNVTGPIVSGSSRKFILPTGDTITITPTASITKPSENPVANTFTYVLNNTGSYLGQRDTVLGDLRINSVTRKVEVISGSATFPYDGSVHTYPYYTVKFDNAAVATTTSSTHILIPATGHYVDITPTFEGISDVQFSEHNNTFTYALRDESGADVSMLYSNRDTVFGTVEILVPQPVVIGDTISKTFDGSPLAALGYNSQSGTFWYSVKSGEDTWETYSTTKPSITEVGTLTYKVKIHDYDDEATAQVKTLKVTPKPITIKADDKTKVYDNYPGQDPDLTATVTGEVTGYFAVFTLSRAQGQNVGDYDITVTPGDNPNYTVSVQNGTFSITPIPITVEAESDTVKYDGLPKSVNGFKTLSFVREVGGINVTYTVSGLEASATGTDAGTYTNTISSNTPVVKDEGNNDVTSCFAVTKVNGALVINKRNLTLTSESGSKEYDGTPLTNSTVTVTGDGFATEEGATYNVTGTQTLVGNSPNTFTYVLNDGTKASNYEIATSTGTLTVVDRTKPYEITVVSDSATFTYDGMQKTVSGFETLTFNKTVGSSDVTFTVSGLTASVGGIDVGTYENVIHGTAVVMDTNDNDVTAQFTVNTVYGKLTINPITETVTVTIVGAHDSTGYDGAEHTITGYTATADNTLYDVNTSFTFTPAAGATLVNNEIAATRTNVGKTDMGLAPEQFANTNTNFANVVFVVTDGWQKIGKAALTITAKDQTYTYTGSAQGPSGTYTEDFDTYVTVSGLQGTDALTSILLSGSQTNVGEYLGQIVASAAEMGTNTGNYDISYVAGKLKITPSTMEVTATGYNNPYDGVSHSISVTVVPAGATVTYSADGTNYSSTNPSYSDVGNYTVYYKVEMDNYETVTGSKLVNITPKEVTLTAKDRAKVYDGAAMTQPGFTATALETGDTHIFNVVMEDTCTITEVGTRQNVIATVDGVAVTTGTATAVGNYQVTIVNGTLTVTKASMSITVNGSSTSKVYNGSQQDYTGTVTATSTATGFVAGKFSYNGDTAVSGTDVGDYTTALAEANCAYNDNNYTVAWTIGNPVKLTITPSTMEVTATGYNNPYDGVSHSISVTVVPAGATVTYSADGTNYSSTNPSYSDVGNYTVYYKVEMDNYTPVIGSATVKITAKSLTITAKPQTYTYTGGAQGPAGIYSDGFDTYVTVGTLGTGDALASITLAGSQVNQGTYAGEIVPSGALIVKDETNVTDNYTITYNNADLTISKRDLTIKLDTTKVYDGTTFVSTLTSASNGNTNGYIVSGLQNNATVSGVVTSALKNVNTYRDSILPNEANITTEFTTSDNINNYNVVYDLKQVITPATLTITADNKTTKYGVVNHDFTYTPTGFVNGEDASVMSGTVTYTGNATTTTSSSIPGTYDITPVVSGLSAANYDFTAVNGALTIGKSDSAITISSPTHNWTYDGDAHSDHGYTVTYGGTTLTGVQEGDHYEYTISSTQDVITITPDPDAVVTGYTSSEVPNAFTYSIAHSDCYATPTVTTGKLTIGKATLTITADNKTTKYGVVNHDFTYTPTGFVNGEDASVMSGTVTYTGNATTTTSSSIPGTYDITPVVSGLSAANYDFTAVNGTLTITADNTHIAISSGSYNGVYDGQSHTAGYTVKYGTQNIDPDANSNGMVFTLPTNDKVTISHPTTITNVGSVSNKFTYVVNNAGYYSHIDTTCGLLKVTPLTVNISVPDTSIEYNGNLHHGKLVIASMFSNVVNGQIPQINYTPSQGTLAGIYYNGHFDPSSFTVTGSSGNVTANYILGTLTPGKLTVADRANPYAVTVVSKSNTGNVYDGQSHSAAGFDTLRFSHDSHIYTVSGLSTADPSSINVCVLPNTITGTAVVKDADSNDVTAQFAVTLQPGTLEITRRHISASVANDTLEFNGQEQLSTKVPVFSNLVEGDMATVDYNPARGTQIGDYNNGEYIPGSLYVKNANGDTITDNYYLSASTTGKLNIAPPPLTVTAKDSTKTYDGTPLVATFTYEPTHTVPTIKYKVKNGETWSDYLTGESIPTITNAGSLTYLVEATANAYTVRDTATLTITKRNVTVTVDNAPDVEYTGADHHSDKEPVFHNVVAGQTPSITYHPAHGIVVGEYVGAYEAETFNVMSGATNLTGNYNLTTLTPGHLTIVNRTEKYTITVKANSDTTHIYDGTAYSAVSYDSIVHVGANGEHHFTVTGLTTTNPTSINTCEIPNVISGTPVVKDIHGHNVTDQFNVNLIDGLLRIKSRPITLRSRPGLKLYDSTALVLNTQSDVIVEGAGFVQGEGATYHITGSQRDVGISANEFTYTLNDGTLETNYDISTQFGTLTVKPDTFGLHIESRSENFVYDGQVHRRNEYRVVYKNVARDTIPGTNGLKFALPTKDTLTITPTFNGITHISQNADSNNTFTYTLQHSDWYEGKRDTVYGTVKILPREVIVHVNGKAKTVFYNGQSQSVTGYEVHFNDTLYNTSYFQYNGDSIATRLIVGQTMMGLHDTNFKHLPQYNDFSPVKFLVTDGFIWIVPDTSAAVVLAGRHSMVDYDGQEHSVHGYDIVSITPNYSADYFIFTGSSTDSAAERTTVGTTFMGLSDTMFRNVNPNFNDVTFKLQSDGYQQINRIEAAVKVVGHADTREYDGAEHVVTGYDLEFTPSFYTANSFTFNGHDTAKRTTEGTSWMGLAESQFVNTDTNFNQVTFTITDGKQVIKPNSTALTLQCPGNLSKPYDGTPLSSGATAYSTIPGDAFVIKYKSKLEGESVFSDWYDTVPSITNFGVKFVEVSCSNPNYLPQSCTYTLSISRRDVQLVSMDSLRIYNGDTLRYDSVKVTGSGFVNGEGATFAVTGNRLLPGSTPNTFTYSLKSNTLADNYQIGTTFGTLRVTERPDSLLYPITVVSNSNPVSTGDIIIYDGLKHTDSNFVTLTFTTEDGHPYTVTGLTAKVSAFDAGTYPNTIHGEPVVLDEYGNDVTDQFNIQLLEGQLVIRKHQVTITVPAEYATMMYNGDSLRVGYENVDISYLAARDTLSGGYFITEGYLEGTYHCSDGNFMATDMTGVASQHDFNIVHGASEEYEAGNSLANYRPSFDVVLTITKRPLEITASSAEKVYDGDPLTLAESDYTLTSGTTLAPTDTLFLTRTGSQACVGETANHITSVTILHKGDWVDVTSSYDITTVDGLLKVTRETDGLTCPPTLHITLTEDTYDTLVSQSLLGTANHALVHEGVATITHNLDEQNPMAAGTHTITWILYDTCQNAMDTCYQTVEVVYTPCEGVTYDGHFYNAERIGFQCWMTENLRNDEDEEGHYLVNCHAYKENQSNVEKFGYLYSWYSAMDVPENNDTASLTYFIGDNGRPYVEGICPDGWAVGNLQDYTALLATVGDSNPLKDAGDGYWYPGMGGTLPNSGFNARANGFYNSVSQRYEDLLTGSHFWMPETDTAAGTAANAVLQYYCSDGLFQQNPKGDLKGVRCIRKVAP